MEPIEVEGIIVKSIDFKESSKILTILTREMGSISCVSKGCKNIKSKLRSISGNLSYGKFQISYHENGLSTLISGSIVNPFLNMMKDITKLSYASYIVELTKEVLKNDANEEIFNDMISSLNKINDGLDPEIISIILEVKYLEYLGIALNVDSCSICGNIDNIITLSITDGGYICKKCYNNQKIYSDKVIKLLRMFTYVDINKITKLDIKQDAIRELHEIIDTYYDDYSGLYIYSKTFLNKLNKVGVV